ncbi:50S ribosomal protein L11 methyltransferase [Eubacteriales bacterium OttesenSCG-928-A19]|nr:50S ribosomal protein L11 methyltransferase [Eubacteriales bacterium OttesenSCG-928-A19]
MEWIEVTVRTNTAGADMVSEQLMRAGAHGTAIEDRYDAEMDLQGPAKWDILDASIVEAMDEDVLVRGYLPSDATAAERVASLRSTLSALTPDRIGFDAGSLRVELANVREQDWAENWKQYYKPFRAGTRLVVKPVWEAYEASPGDLVLEIDPGMAFGNGTHETTAMCLRLLETLVKPGDAVLDVGTGSGILAMAASALGAGEIVAIDLDPVAVRVARENIARNGMGECIDARVGDLLAGVSVQASLVVANIIADAIILLAQAARKHLLPGGAFLSSGIIRDREADVVRALEAAGLTIEHIEREGEWIAIVARS